MPSEPLTITCHECGETKPARPSKAGNPTLPASWKRCRGLAWCNRCWRRSYYLCAHTMPVAGPVDDDWPALREALKAAWADSTALANWLYRYFFNHDVVRRPDDEKMPAMAGVDPYQAARAAFPELPSDAVGAIQHAVRGKYARKRYEIVWTSEASLPNARYPQPYPVRGKAWKASLDADQRPVIEFRLAGKRWRLRLRAGPGFHRQLAAFRKLVAGDGLQAELAILRKPANDGDHRKGVVERDDKSNIRQKHRVMAKMVMWLPKRTNGRAGVGTMTVRTLPGSFLVARAPNRTRCEWRLHADHARRWIAMHRHRLARLSDDTKAELRGRRQRLAHRRHVFCTKHANRIATFIDQATCNLANYAARCHVAEVLYDDNVREYLPAFPYSEFWTKLATKLDRQQISLVTVADRRRELQERKAGEELAALETLLTAILEEKPS